MHLLIKEFTCDGRTLCHWSPLQSPSRQSWCISTWNVSQRKSSISPASSTRSIGQIKLTAAQRCLSSNNLMESGIRQVRTRKETEIQIEVRHDLVIWYSDFPGPELLVMQWMPCSVTKLVSFISQASGKRSLHLIYHGKSLEWLIHFSEKNFPLIRGGLFNLKIFSAFGGYNKENIDLVSGLTMYCALV